ncbi:nadh dehydrogenase (ndh2-ii) [Cystoisospora suis]|uniref:NADH:ubiquinone reductase (non-electrogenic) n=1 Tax=Cystoisospora suis TaxID=483139 RepID=A0A2C6KUN6_9APIC|nr:nadh dehydrogenase (ndh2-ii) [Cystoisospora suis]
MKSSLHSYITLSSSSSHPLHSCAMWRGKRPISSLSSSSFSSSTPTTTTTILPSFVSSSRSLASDPSQLLSETRKSSFLSLLPAKTCLADKKKKNPKIQELLFFSPSRHTPRGHERSLSSLVLLSPFSSSSRQCLPKLGPTSHTHNTRFFSSLSFVKQTFKSIFPSSSSSSLSLCENREKNPSLSSSSSYPPGKKQRVVVLGTGWASVNFFRNLNPSLYDVTVISPRNYFTFTPLLPSVCAGTLSPLSCIEPIRTLTRRNGKKIADFYEAHCTDIDFNHQLVCCENRQGGSFKLKYDYLVIGVGSDINTYGIRDVSKHAFFLKEVEHAMFIRKKVMSNFELAALPNTPEREKSRLLHFVVVGGGPTGVETAAEFADFILEDMNKYFPQLAAYVNISLIEGGKRLLGTYPLEISSFAEKILSDDLHVKLFLNSTVVGVDKDSIRFVKNVSRDSHNSSLGKDKAEGEQKTQLSLQGYPNVYAFGDCSTLIPSPMTQDAHDLYSRAGSSDLSPQWLLRHEKVLEGRYPQLNPLKFDYKKLQTSERMDFNTFKALLNEIDTSYRPPAPTAQNARQEGHYLARVPHMERGEKKGALFFDLSVFRFLLRLDFFFFSRVCVGSGQAVAHLPYGNITGGFFSLPFWKAVYIQMQVTWRSRTICLFDWLKTFFAGRDVGREHEYYTR